MHKPKSKEEKMKAEYDRLQKALLDYLCPGWQRDIRRALYGGPKRFHKAKKENDGALEKQKEKAVGQNP